MSGANATFSMDVPVFDAYPTVTNAAAALVPEPGTWWLAVVGTCGASLARRWCVVVGWKTVPAAFF